MAAAAQREAMSVWQVLPRRVLLVQALCQARVW
jgi:hypothetical protein